MKFDVIVGNPPYQEPNRSGNSLWPQFTRLASRILKENGSMSLVVPGRWVLPGKNGSDRLFDTVMKKNTTTLINLGECSKHFSAGSDSEYFSYFVLTKKIPENSLTKIITTSDTFSINLQDIEWLPYKNCSKETTLLVNKIFNQTTETISPKWTYDRKHILENKQSPTHPYPVFLGKNVIRYSNVKSLCHDQKKLIFKLGRFIKYEDRLGIDLR